MMHRYSVTYIARGGEFATQIVYARNKRAAREKAEELCLEDIKSVKRVRQSDPIGPFLIIVAVIVLIIVISVRGG